MGRPPGARNADFTAQRAVLVAKLAKRLMATGGARASMRELAAAADVSVATLQHYFRDRAGAMIAVLEDVHTGGAEHLAAVASGPTGTLRASLRWFLDYLSDGLVDYGLDHLHEFGIVAGVDDAAIGPAYLEHVLEPTLRALEARLERHQAAGQLRPCDLRVAAIQIVAPLLVAVLHQRALGGAAVRPMALDAFVDAHLDALVRAYATAPPRRR